MKSFRFIHIPKTGGTSLCKYLSENNVVFFYGQEPKRVGKHRYASEWINEDSFKFTIVRNPYHRIVSFYNFTITEIWRPTFEEFVKNKLMNNDLKVHSPWILQTRWIYDASYVKLREVVFAYTIPPKRLGKTPFKSMKIALVGRDLWTIYRNTPQGIDPESNTTSGNGQGIEYGSFLPTRTVGLNLKFDF
jgi:hypothetical protein